MDILFCDRCHESIPDADLESGKAVRVGGKIFHVPCALRRAMPGPGRVLVALLAIGAAAGAAYAVARADATDAKPLPAEMPVAWRRAVASDAAEVAGEQVKALAESQRGLETKVSAEIQRAADGLEKGVKTELQREIAKLDGMMHGSSEAHLSRLEAVERRVEEVAHWAKEVKDIASRAPSPADAVVPQPPPPTVATATPPPAPETPPPAPVAATDPEAQRRHDLELEKWIRDLKDPNNGIAFTATYKLKEMKDLRAVPPLVETLEKHKDYYTRLGAAVALGELKAADAVNALVEAFDDKEELVQQAAAEAFMNITGQDVHFKVASTRKERKAAKETAQRWWKDHEPEVRQRLGQPLSPMK
jgi:hypothetical protein